jgi:dolichol-phosphate mannosyltransferase
MKINNPKIAIVIPFYNASKHIVEVVAKLPEFIHTIIIVNDKSDEPLPEKEILKVLNSKTKIEILNNIQNLGVGGATKIGFSHAINNQFDYVIKMDADNQMDAKFLPELIKPLTNKKAEMAKGNRFSDRKYLKEMPFVRRFGNLILSFLTKIASGYWNNFDPTNGYFAIKTKTLQKIDFAKLSDRYFFETSLLAQLYFVKARIKDIPMPPIYADEKSSMTVWKMPSIFIPNLFKIFVKRIFKTYFLYDFNIASLYLITGFPLFVFGLSFGIYNWIYYYNRNTFTPTGTIMLVTLTIILGFQLLLQAIQFDISNAPRTKIKD